jgi:hypothetical protein
MYLINFKEYEYRKKTIQPQAESKPREEVERSKDKVLVDSSRDLAFILNQFPKIDRKVAQEIVDKVNRNQISDSRFGEDNKRGLMMDYILRNNINNQNLAQFNANLKLEPTFLTLKNSFTFKLSDFKRPTIFPDSKSSGVRDEDFAHISSIVEDCQPSYIIEQLKAHSNKPYRVQFIVDQMIEGKNYPKIDRLRLKLEQEIERHFNLEIDIEEFLKLYPDPHDYFYKPKRELSELYKNYNRTFLANTFRLIDRNTIEKVLIDNEFNLTLSYKELCTVYNGSEDNLKEKIRVYLENHRKKNKNAQQNPPSKIICFNLLFLLF